DDYQFGVTRAAGAIAETGSLILTEATTARRLAALAPWIHIAVLDPERIHEHVGEAIAALGDDPNVIWCTGPSKTADVEGISRAPRDSVHRAPADGVVRWSR